MPPSQTTASLGCCCSRQANPSLGPSLLPLLLLRSDPGTPTQPSVLGRSAPHTRLKVQNRPFCFHWGGEAGGDLSQGLPPPKGIQVHVWGGGGRGREAMSGIPELKEASRRLLPEPGSCERRCPPPRPLTSGSPACDISGCLPAAQGHAAQARRLPEAGRSLAPRAAPHPLGTSRSSPPPRERPPQARRAPRQRLPAPPRRPENRPLEAALRPHGPPGPTRAAWRSRRRRGRRAKRTHRGHREARAPERRRARPASGRTPAPRAPGGGRGAPGSP